MCLEKSASTNDNRRRYKISFSTAGLQDQVISFKLHERSVQHLLGPGHAQTLLGYLDQKAILLPREQQIKRALVHYLTEKEEWVYHRNLTSKTSDFQPLHRSSVIRLQQRGFQSVSRSQERVGSVQRGEAERLVTMATKLLVATECILNKESVTDRKESGESLPHVQDKLRLEFLTSKGTPATKGGDGLRCSLLDGTRSKPSFRMWPGYRSTNCQGLPFNKVPSGGSKKRLPRIKTAPPIRNRGKAKFLSYRRHTVKDRCVQTETELADFQNAMHPFVNDGGSKRRNSDSHDNISCSSSECSCDLTYFETSLTKRNNKKTKRRLFVHSDKESRIFSTASPGDGIRKYNKVGRKSKSLKNSSKKQLHYDEMTRKERVDDFVKNESVPWDNNGVLPLGHQSSTNPVKTKNSAKKQDKQQKKKHITCNLENLCTENELKQRNTFNSTSEQELTAYEPELALISPELEKTTCKIISPSNLAFGELAIYPNENKESSYMPSSEHCENGVISKHNNVDENASEFHKVNGRLIMTSSPSGIDRGTMTDTNGKPTKISSISASNQGRTIDANGKPTTMSSPSVSDQGTTTDSSARSTLISSPSVSDQGTITEANNSSTTCSCTRCKETSSSTCTCTEDTASSVSDAKGLEMTSCSSCDSYCSCCSSYTEEYDNEECPQCLQENSNRKLTPEVLIVSPQDYSTEIVTDTDAGNEVSQQDEEFQAEDIIEQEEPERTSNSLSVVSAPYINKQGNANPSNQEGSGDSRLDIGAVFDQLAQEEFVSTLSIHEAARNGDLRAVRLLLRNDWKRMETVDERGWTPIHLAAANGHVEIVQYLGERGAHLSALDPSGYTAIHIAAMNGHAECVEVLLDMGSEVDNVTSDGFTPLHLAVLNASVDCCQVLISWGANINREDGLGRTIYEMVEEYSLNEIMELLESYEKKVENFHNILHTFSDQQDPQSTTGLPHNLSAMFRPAAECDKTTE
ncbi:uncharacterized protein LOC143233758 isoform X2 [Tachypleus tridentatus]|uniref:uncharacterized protein LOC143233758 isoform X2 n=1 Tax=Tachypleus tridentatus TaxID=6853 RepID=UPI003FD53D4F